MIMFFPDCVNISSYSLTFSIKDLRCKFDYGKLDLDLLLAYKEVNCDISHIAADFP